MPITVSCSGCGKRLKVRDELIGKKLKCPDCGVTFLASGAQTAMPRAGAVKSKAPALAVSWGLITGIAIVVLIIGGILAFVFGPVSVWHQWEALGSTPNDTVDEVVTFGLKAFLSETGSWNPRKPGHDPHSNDDTIFIRSWSMSMPQTMTFKGTSNQGNFTGKYHPKTGEVEADVSVGGTNLGGVTVKDGTTQIHVTGRMKGGQVSAEVNGHVAEIHYPPETDDDK